MIDVVFTKSGKALLTLACAAVTCAAAGQFDAVGQEICPACSFPLVVDMDQDGDPDLIYTLPELESISWQENLGNGTFAGAVPFAVNQRHLAIDVAADVDDDGDVDLVGVSLADQTDSLVAILRNDDGFFILDTVDHPMTAARTLDQLTDLDVDGDLDLLSLNTGEEDIWYRNTGGGDYQRERIAHWCAGVGGPYVVLDAENDGDPDLIRYSAAEGRFLTIWNLGGGQFGPWSYATPPLQQLTFEPAAGKLDPDQDGLMDLVCGGRVLYSNGNGTFAVSGSIQPLDFQSLANVNCGEAAEAVLSSSVYMVTYIRFLDQTGQIIPVQPPPSTPVRTALHDLNMDGRNDLLIGPVAGSGAVSWRNNVAVPVQVTLDLPADTVQIDTVMALSGGFPQDGGYFTGAGVFDNTLYASIAGSGPVAITYHYLSFNTQNLCGGTATDTVYIVDFTGISEHPAGGPMLFPNPANGTCCLVGIGHDGSDAVLYDGMGRRAPLDPVSAQREGSFCFRTAQLAEGQWFLRLSNGKGASLAVRFLVSHPDPE